MKRHLWGIIIGIFLIITVPVYGQIGHGTSDPSKAAVVEMLSPSKGLLIPRVALTGLTDFSTIQGEAGTGPNSIAKTNSLLVYNTATEGTVPNNVTPGYYYWTTDGITGKWNRLVNDADIAALGLNVTADNGLTKTGDNIQLGGTLQPGTTTIATSGATNTLAITGLQKGVGDTSERIIVVDPTNGVLKQLKAALPKFFYMPSIIIPTEAAHIPLEYNSPSYMAFDDGAKTGYINLHAIYAAQFNGISGSSVKNLGAGTGSLPVIPANELNYYITWYDNTLFDNVAVTNTGILTYHVSGSTADEGSFMNIVFEVRETPSSP